MLALAAEMGAASADHLEHASDWGIEAMARAGVCGVLLPAAAFFLMQDRRPPGRKLVDAGVPVVVANRASLPEMVDDAGILLEPNDVDALTAMMLRISRMPSSRLASGPAASTAPDRSHGSVVQR